MAYVNKNEPVAGRRRVFVYVYTDDGVTPAPLATTFSTAGEKRYRAGGTSYANAAGTFTNTGIDGEWIYEFTQAETNVVANEISFNIIKPGFMSRSPQIEVRDPSDFVAALMAYSHDTGVTMLGYFRRSEALISGKATGLKGAIARFFRRDGITAAIVAAQNVRAGTREAANVSGSEP